MGVEKVTDPGLIPLDRLVGGRPSAQVVWLDAQTPQIDQATREPHRHDYHELFLLVAGTMDHVIDGKEVDVGPGSALMLGRGQVHTLHATAAVRGVIVRFSEDLLVGAAQPLSQGWMLALTRTGVMRPAASELARMESLVRVLDGELDRRHGLDGEAVVGHLLSAVLAMVLRWQADDGPPPAGDGAHGRAVLVAFAELLEAEYSRRHDVAWYADQLAVTPDHLATTLRGLTGRSTKRLLVDRIMTEAQRLLRYTDLPVQQISGRLGYEDPMYFSRAFKAQTGLSPLPYRRGARR